MSASACGGFASMTGVSAAGVSGFTAACLGNITSAAAAGFNSSQVSKFRFSGLDFRAMRHDHSMPSRFVSYMPNTFAECAGIGASITGALSAEANGGWTALCAARLTAAACAGFQAMGGMSTAGVRA